MEVELESLSSSPDGFEKWGCFFLSFFFYFLLLDYFEAFIEENNAIMIFMCQMYWIKFME